MKVDLIPFGANNYIFAIHDAAGRVVIVDPGEAEPVLRYLEQNRLQLDAIWITHHHHDHIDGVEELRLATKALVCGPTGLEHYGLKPDRILSAGDKVQVGSARFEVIDISGHTQVHIGYYSAGESALFSGDTLFSLGCGRIFDGSLEALYISLGKIKSLPIQTKIYCTHEYTARNCEFALKYFPQAHYAELLAQIHQVRNQAKPTVPTSVKYELENNVFLQASDFTEFVKLRTLRNTF